MKSTVVLLLIAVGALTACSDTPPTEVAEGWHGSTTVSGDTTVVTTISGAVHGSVTIDSIDAVYASDDLESPFMLAALDSQTIAIADPLRVHLVSTDGAFLGSLGRDGEGPGEFRTIGAIGGSGDTVVALDRRNQRFAIFLRDGTVLESGLLTQADRLANLQAGRVSVVEGVLTVGWGSRISFSGTINFGGIAKHFPIEARAEELGRVIGQSYIFSEEAGSAGRAELYGPEPLTAVSPNGKHAMTDGVEYCVETAQPDGTAPMHICRDWQREPVPESIRNPDYEAIAEASGYPLTMFESFRILLPEITVGEQRNAIDAINYDSEGRLWVKVVDSLTSDVHPFLERFAGKLGAKAVHWDIFGTDGRLEWQLVVPAWFTPWDAIGNTVYGLYERDDGAIVVGKFGIRLDD